MIEMVGVGPFVVIPLVIKAMGGPQCLLAWAAGAVLALLDGFVWSELGAAMPLAGGSYVFLREAYGPGRMGRMMSFLFVWQTLIQAPLSLASGAIGFSQYASYLYPLGKYGEKALSGALVIALVLLLYRRISSIGRISLFLWAGVIGTILWLIWGGVTHFQPKLVFTYAPGSWDFSWLFFAMLGSATVNTIYTYWGYYNICHLGGEIRNPERNIPRGIFLSIIGIAVLYLAMQTSILGVLPWQQAQDSPFIVSAFIEKLYGSAAARFATRNDLVDCVCVSVFVAAGIFARSVFGGAGWEFFQRICACASEKALSARIVAVSRRIDVCFRAAVQAAHGDCRGAGHAVNHSIHRTGRGRDAIAAAVVSGPPAL